MTPILPPPIWSLKAVKVCFVYAVPFCARLYGVHTVQAYSHHTLWLLLFNPLLPLFYKELHIDQYLYPCFSSHLGFIWSLFSNSSRRKARVSSVLWFSQVRDSLSGLCAWKSALLCLKSFNLSFSLSFPPFLSFFLFEYLKCLSSDIKHWTLLMKSLLIYFFLSQVTYSFCLDAQKIFFSLHFS